MARWRLGHLFSLGLRGLIGAFAWLAIPTFLFAAADKPEGGLVLITILGGLLLMLIFSWLPFLQARFAAENRLRAFFECERFGRRFGGPLWRFCSRSWALCLGVAFVSFQSRLAAARCLGVVDAVVHHQHLPGESAFRLGVSSGDAKTRPRLVLVAVAFALGMLPFLAAYVFLLFFTQFIGAQGKLVLFQHHAFLLPVPF